MRADKSTGARLETRKTYPRELWLIGAFVIIVGVTIVTVLIPAIQNEHPDEDTPAVHPSHTPH